MCSKERNWHKDQRNGSALSCWPPVTVNPVNTLKGSGSVEEPTLEGCGGRVWFYYFVVVFEHPIVVLLSLVLCVTGLLLQTVCL